MAAQPRITQQPRYTPRSAGDNPYDSYPRASGYGARSRETIPMEPSQQPRRPDVPLEYFPPLSENSEVGFREICGGCQGAGYAPGQVVRCHHRDEDGRECRSVWWRETVYRHGRLKGFRERIMILPCGHDIRVDVLNMSWEPPKCRICKGEGTLTRWVRLGDVLNWFYPDDEGGEQTTQAMRVFSQAHNVVSFDPWLRSDSKPTAPTAPPTPSTYQQQAPQHQQQQQIPVTPRFMTPLRPDDVNGDSF